MTEKKYYTKHNSDKKRVSSPLLKKYQQKSKSGYNTPGSYKDVQIKMDLSQVKESAEQSVRYQPNSMRHGQILLKGI